MNRALIDNVVAATLYEGYLLYPYRASSVKNRHRWTFGGLVPEPWADAYERSEIRVQCMAMADDANATIEVQGRFLQQADRAGASSQEVIERAIDAPPVTLRELVRGERVVPFHFEAGPECCELLGELIFAAERLAPDVFRMTARLRNTTPVEGLPPAARDELMRHALGSAHLTFGIEGGRFASATDPPEELRDHAAACQNEGVWPVLVGDPNEANLMLASPMILYDYPQIAAQSPGDLFDGTEIDEILSLRILTMTDAEKAEASCDERARAIVERTESLSQEQRSLLHGAWTKGGTHHG